MSSMNSQEPLKLKFPHVLIVEASAGSGKTFCLARRFLQLLINPSLESDEIPLDSILAITFTNKAAIEMKERILEFLKKAALDVFSSQEEKESFLGSLGVAESAARAKAILIMEYIIRNYNFFQVQTIDSFINAILYGCSFKLNLSSNFKIEKDYRDYLRYSLDMLIDRAADDTGVRELFYGFLRQYLHLDNRAGWFPKEDIIAMVASLFSQSNKHAGSFIRFGRGECDLGHSKRELLGLLKQLQDNLPETAHKNFSRSLALFLERHRENFAIDELSDYFKRQEPPVKKGSILGGYLQDLWREIKRQIGQLCEREASCSLEYYLAIYNAMLDDFRRLTHKADVLFLEALNKEAHRLFDEHSLVLPELYYRLATSFKHFLIDEFQDTSSLQWENLLGMVNEALSTGGSLFYVGDKKQAIYRFRGGEVALLDSVRESFRGLISEQFLTTNYRSGREIVEFNNELFSEQNLRRFLQKYQEAKKEAVELTPRECDEIVRVFEGSRQTSRDSRESGFVRCEYIDLQNRQDRQASLKTRLLSLVKELKARFSYKDIALLVRKNDQVELLTSWLLEGEIPVESEKTLDIRQHGVIKELVSFLAFLNSPIDNVAFASFILGDIFLKASGLSFVEMQDFIMTAGAGEKKGMYLYKEFRDTFPGGWDSLIESFFKSVGFVPLYELTISIFLAFGLLDNFPSSQGFFMRFLELIKEKEEDYASIASFLDFFKTAAAEDFYVRVSESDAVKVLTIHKAKGLEFPVVIAPFVEMTVAVESEVLVEQEEGLGLLRLKKVYAEFSPALLALYRYHYTKSLIDELCNLYVAFTRPKVELYLFLGPKADTGLNMARVLLPENNFQRGDRRAHSDKAGAEDASEGLLIPPPRYKDWIGLLKDECVKEEVLIARKNIRRGEVVHCVLSYIGNLYGRDEKAIVAGALEMAKARFPNFKEFDEVMSAVKSLLGKESLKKYFYAKDAKVFLERELADSRGAIRRVDRLVIKDKEATILDYKSSRSKEEDYRTQIREYVKIVREIYPRMDVKGVLLYLDDLGIEEITWKE